jgi:cyclic pyranopterin phosphate synthase
MAPREFTHLDPLGRARMVDVTPKPQTARRAIARGRITMQPETATMIATGGISKGDVLGVARVAAIQAAKQTPALIPLCHSVAIGGLYVNFRIEETFVEVEARAETVDRTGVEMEALTAVSVACLTVYDMCKSADRAMTIEGIALWEKSGGRSGVFRRSNDGDTASPDDMGNPDAGNPDAGSPDGGGPDVLESLPEDGDASAHATVSPDSGGFTGEGSRPFDR